MSAVASPLTIERVRLLAGRIDGQLSAVRATMASDDGALRRELLAAFKRVVVNEAVFGMLDDALCDDQSLATRTVAMEVLAGMGAHAVPILARRIQDSRPNVRRLVVDALGMSRTVHAAPALLQAVTDPNAAVRAAALEALVRVAPNQAEATLLKAADNPAEHASVTLAALLGLLQLGRAPPTSVLRAHVRNPVCAPAALRLLGLAGDTVTLVDAMLANAGSRRRAALMGLDTALQAGAMLPPMLRSDGTRQVLMELVSERETQVAAAAIRVGVRVAAVDVLLRAVTREDRAILTSVCHAGAQTLLAARPDLPDVLRQAAIADADAAPLLREIADALRPGRPSEACVDLDATTYGLLCQLFERVAGLSFSDEARSRIESRLRPRVQASGAPNFASYVRLLTAQGPELAHALELVTVHETYFFRERAQLEALQNDLLPRLQGQSLRMWSAGASTGEEAYSLAITAAVAGFDDVEVIGTDLAPGTLDFARGAVYPARSFRGEVDERIRRTYFVDEPRGVRVAASVAAHVRFIELNLVDDVAIRTTLPRFHVVFCRNVLIYLTQSARKRVIAALHERLLPGGVLFLGHSESLLHVESPFLPVTFGKALAYQRSLA